MDGIPFRFCVPAVVLVLAAISGCGRRDAAPYPTYATPSLPYVPREGAGNAFDGYVRAAILLRGEDDLLRRTAFDAIQRTKAIRAAGPAVRAVAAAQTSKCDFQFTPHSPFAPSEYAAPWRMIGRVLVWQIQESVDAARYDEAIDRAGRAIRFGLDLTGGGAEEISLGWTIVAEARRALAPSMPAMGAAQLRRLSQLVKRLYLARPPMEAGIDHIEAQMMQAVEAIQTAFRQDDLKPVEAALGPDAKDPVQYLRDLRSAGDGKRVRFFEGFAAEAKATADRMREMAKLPASDRPVRSEPRGERPWKRFARHFFGVERPLLALVDTNRARTQMMILDAELLRTLKLTHTVPRDLNGFSPELTVDPFIGTSLGFRSDGLDYRLYSVGADLTDNGGSHDETFTIPDLVLERPNL